MKIKMKNVRLSFPSLFETEQFGEQDTGKYAATFILDKDDNAAEIKQIQDEINRLMKEELKTKLPDDKVALKDGDDMGRPEYEGKMTIKGSTKKRPLVIDRDKTPLSDGDDKPYAGCYVNGIISLWAQNNKYGKRVNASLEGVQFSEHGEPFTTGGVSVDEFDDFDDEDDAFSV